MPLTARACAFFVANVYVNDPAQLHTAFAGEQYSKDNAEATSAIAERHDAILAFNGDYYNYKDKNGLIIATACFIAMRLPPATSCLS